ncbi:hypothetical protein N7493_005351 [Penicillium malachiteum]|uniref:Uncharacterized protein n=1 Tax=Penicillium malachiteum TaxID=1324776 RepID=A0AAD6HNC0_9EURO|nr:hypothetical protein N7493_005351 [Penicillium malachiteum]
MAILWRNEYIHRMSDVCDAYIFRLKASYEDLDSYHGYQLFQRQDHGYCRNRYPAKLYRSFQCSWMFATTGALAMGDVQPSSANRDDHLCKYAPSSGFSGIIP